MDSGSAVHAFMIEIPMNQTLSEKSASYREAFDLCLLKSRRNIRDLADQPSSWSSTIDGHYDAEAEDFFSIGNWTSSFHTGMALLAYRKTADKFFLQQTLRLEPLYVRKVQEERLNTMHDLGFLYSLYSVALHRLTGDSRHRETGLHAAEALAGRFHPTGKFIQAWGRMDEHDPNFLGLAIIDCMMNLPLLYWASEESGDPRFREIAIQHADMTLARFVRKDDSVFHAFRFDAASGQPLRGENFCGRAVDSHWARGTAWAIYGFALSHHYTQDERYLEIARRLAWDFVSKLDEEIIPLWDFRLSADEEKIRDASAAAIAVCGIQQLERCGAADPSLLAAKRKLLNRLCSSEYMDSGPSHHGIIKNAQVGDDRGQAINAYSSWGDYFFMEALDFELHQQQGFW